MTTPPRGRGRRPGAIAAALGALLAAACTHEPSVRAHEGADTRSARRLLAEQVKTGPLPVEVRNPPEGFTPQRVAQTAASGISGLRVTPEIVAPGSTGQRLVLWFGQSYAADAACRDAAPAADERRVPASLLAVYCDGERAQASAEGQASDLSAYATDRLIWQTTQRLFPDDYADTYGFDLLGNRVGVGGSFGF